MKTREKKTYKNYVRIQNKASLNAIARRYAEGEPSRDIAARYDIDVATVREIARRAGVPVRPVGRPRSR